MITMEANFANIDNAIMDANEKLWCIQYSVSVSYSFFSGKVNAAAEQGKQMVRRLNCSSAETTDSFSGEHRVLCIVAISTRILSRETNYS